MSQFNRPPQPKYSPEQLAEYLRDTNGVLDVSVKVLLRGSEEKADEVYKPWPKEDVQKQLASILGFFEVKVKYYEGAGETQKAKVAKEEAERLRNIFSEIDNSEEIPKGFLQRVQREVETAMVTAEGVRQHFDHVVNLEPWFTEVAGLYEVAPEYREDPKGYFADTIKKIEDRIAKGDNSQELKDDLAKYKAYLSALEEGV